METSKLLLLTATGAASLSFCISWLSSSVSNRRAIKSARLHASVSASNQAVTSAKNQYEMIKRICMAGKNDTGYLRMSVIDRFGTVIFDTDGNNTIMDESLTGSLQAIFDKAKKDEPVILKRSLLDIFSGRSAVAVIMVPIFENSQPTLMLCAIGKANHYVDKQHIDLLKEFVGDIEFGMKAFALEKHKEASIKRINVIGKLFDDSKDGIAVTDINGFIIEANKSYCDMNKISANQIRNKIIGEFNSTEKRSMIQTKLKIDSEWNGERILTNKDGKTYLSSVRITPIKHHESETQLLVMMIDQSQQLEMKNEVNYLSNHDQLTGLPNKKNFQLKVQELLSSIRDDSQKIAFFYVAVNEFNYMTDAVWDKNSEDVIKLLSTRLVGHLTPNTIIGRVGNSDFLIATKVDNAIHAKTIADNLLQSISIGCTFDDLDIELSPIIGVSIYPENGKTVIELASSSQRAIKSLGNNRTKRIKFAEKEIVKTSTKEQIKFENDLKKSIVRGELELYYQPQVHLKNSNVIGYEALIRWNNPTLGIIYPDNFIGIAERNGFIVEMGHWVIQEACRQIVVWKQTKKNKFKVAVNVSPIQFFDEHLVDVIKKSIKDYNIEPGELELEITESAIMEDEAHAIKILGEIKDLGVILSIDDFGVGHSSLAYLKKLPVHKVKIDRSFVTDLPYDKHSATIVKAILSIADALNMSVVAEGIENTEQEKFMRQHHCLHGQGMLYGMPVKATDAIH